MSGDPSPDTPGKQKIASAGPFGSLDPALAITALGTPYSGEPSGYAGRITSE